MNCFVNSQISALNHRRFIALQLLREGDQGGVGGGFVQAGVGGDGDGEFQFIHGFEAFW